MPPALIPVFMIGCPEAFFPLIHLIHLFQVVVILLHLAASLCVFHVKYYPRGSEVNHHKHQIRHYRCDDKPLDIELVQLCKQRRNAQK